MLVRLYPDQISANWDLIKFAVVKASPPWIDWDDERTNMMLQAFLKGTIVAWLVLRDDDLHAVLVTTTIRDFNSGGMALLIYTLYGFEFNDLDLWLDTYKSLSDYARAIGCDSITGYTDNSKLATMGERMGGKWLYFVMAPLANF
jgi:hypothetical protein